MNIQTKWIVNERKAHKRAMVKPMRPIGNKENAEQKAREYALWLLQRDGKPVPNHYLCCNWAWFNGEKRIKTVVFGDAIVDLPGFDFKTSKPLTV
jgi:hypothetical protein